jgi:two-component system, OmpR family, sensor histidine kinase KdpD
MNATLRTPSGRARHIRGAIVGVVAVAAVSGCLFALRPYVPVLSLGALYLFAVLPVAIFFGLPSAIAVSIASMLAFNFFFLPPVHTLALHDSSDWFALAVFLTTAVVVSELAARARRRADESWRREREAAFLADVAVTLLQTDRVQPRLKDVAERVAAVLGLSRARIELESVRRPEHGEAAIDLQVGSRHVGRLFHDAADDVSEAERRRILPALASILGVAIDRERLSHAALEAETLRRSDAVKTAVLRAVSHDLRSPLTAIRAAGEGLAREDIQLDSDDRAALLETITGEAARLERLVANLIDLSRLEAGAAEPRPALLTGDELVGRAIDTIGAAAERVVVRLPEEPVAAFVDGPQIERALVNLIENALKFSAAPEPIEVEVVRVADELHVVVRDHGPGLTRAELSRIFEPFTRATDVRGGTGLGLAIATGFARANHGRVSAESVPGQGAVFTLALPLADVPAAVRG